MKKQPIRYYYVTFSYIAYPIGKREDKQLHITDMVLLDTSEEELQRGLARIHIALKDKLMEIDQSIPASYIVRTKKQILSHIEDEKRLLKNIKRK